ncbi:MAG: tRNA (adenosine(37)-N6)-threonylcarbamoyltransferase complex ATPase subunit type 1 TsaE [Syntrophales bacterium]|jgi:tRNA threonylcarbamoyladenosine biosynthesis protein TsaE
MNSEYQPLTIVSESPEFTAHIGRILGGILEKGDVVALIGELGAGKTCLTQGIARGIGVPECYEITSPTFTLINEYPGCLKLIHIDMYRLEGCRDLDDTGYDDLFDEKGVMVIEWAEKIREVLPDGAWSIHITYLDEQKRVIEIFRRDKGVLNLSSALSEGGI